MPESRPEHLNGENKGEQGIKAEGGVRPKGFADHDGIIIMSYHVMQEAPMTTILACSLQSLT